MQASKNDKIDGKINYVYIHPSVRYQVGLAMMAGELKYGAWNYMKGHKASSLFASTGRHLDEWFYSKVDFDADCSERVGTQVHHIANAIAGLQMLLAQIIEGTVIDDRPEKPFKVLDTKEKNNKHWEPKTGSPIDPEMLTGLTSSRGINGYTVTDTRDLFGGGISIRDKEENK